MIGSINHDLVDRFTLGHFAIGIASQVAGATFGQSVAIAVLWEFLERPLKVTVPGMFPHPSQDTFRNAAADVVAWAAGYYLAGLRVA